MLKQADIIAKQINRAEQELIEQRVLGEEDDGMAVLFTGNHHDAFPRFLVLNQDLLPIEKITWQVIRLTINDPTRPGSVPRRAELAAMANCSAPTLTVSRNMLRIQRWMTLCKTVRRQGRFVGDIYLLNDEPLSLITTMEFDPSYVRFLEVQAQSSTKRIREAAAKALAEVADLQSGIEPTESDVLINRLDRMFNLDGRIHPHTDKVAQPNDQSKILSPVAELESQSNFSQSLNIESESEVTHNQSKNFSMDKNDQRKNLSMVENDRSKNLSLDGKQKISFSSGSSSSFINNKYISTARVHAKDESTDPESLANYLEIRRRGRYGVDHEAEDAWVCRYLPWLAYDQFEKYTLWLIAGRQSCLPAIYRKIKSLPTHAQELVVFQLLGATAAAVHGWRDSIRDPIAYLHKLVSLQQTNELVPDEWALELMRCYHESERRATPGFVDSPDLKMRRELMSD